MLGKALHTLGAQGVGTLGALVFGVVLARALGPAGRGGVSYALLVLGLVAIYADGPASAVVAQYAGDKLRRDDVYSGLLRVLPLLVGPAALGFIVVGVALPSQRVLIAVAFALPPAIYAQCVKGFFLAEGRIPTANMLDLASVAGYAALGSAVVLLGGGVTGALISWVAAYVLAAMYGALQVRAAPPLMAAQLRGRPATLAREVLVFGGKSGLVYAVGYVNLRMGAFVVAALLGSAALGVYTIVMTVSELLWKISNALAWTAFGRIAGDDDDAVRELVGRLTRSIVLIELPLGAAAFAFGPWLIERLYGPAFAGAGLPLRVMILGVMAYAVEPVLGYFVLVRCKRPLLVLAIQLGSALVCAAIACAAIPRFGLAGAAAATATTYTAVVVFKSCIVARTLNVPLRELIVPRPADVRAVSTALRAFAGRQSARLGKAAA